MSARDDAQVRNRVARAMLAKSGEVLPELDRRRGAAAKSAADSLADVLSADERTIFDTLMARLGKTVATSIDVDLVEHCMLVARNNARAKLCQAGARR